MPSPTERPGTEGAAPPANAAAQPRLHPAVMQALEQEVARLLRGGPAEGRPRDRDGINPDAVSAYFRYPAAAHNTAPATAALSYPPQAHPDATSRYFQQDVLFPPIHGLLDGEERPEDIY